MWREQDADKRAVIVHPRWRHTLDVARQPPPPVPDWHALPLEVVSLIAAQLELPRDVLSLAATCRDARYLASCNRIWRKLCLCRFAVPEGGSAAAAAAARQEGFWLSLYKFNHHIFTEIIRRGASRPGGAFGSTQGPLVIQLS